MCSNHVFKLIFNDERLSTLQHWPFKEEDSAGCTAEKLAAAGFYCPDPKRDPETVKCFLCLKELDGWDPMDDPMEEHRNHSSGCDFVKMGFKDVNDMTLKEYYKIYRCQSVHYMDSMKDRLLKEYQQKLEECKTTLL